MLNLLAAARQSIRSLLRSPGFTLVALLTLAVGIGASATVWAALHRVVLAPLPYPDSDRLVRLRNEVPGIGSGDEWNMAAVQYFFLRENARSIEEIGAFLPGEASILTADGPGRVRMALASASTLRMLGARPSLGRTFGDSDDAPGAPPVAVLSASTWQTQFAADPAVLGRTIDVFGIPAVIVGVLDADLTLPPDAGGATPPPTGVWIPLAAVDSRFNPQGPFYNNHTTPMLARLAPGVSARQAQLELDRLTPVLAAEHPEVYGGGFVSRYGFRTVAYPLKDHVIGGMAGSLWILSAGMVLVLLVAAANLANLFLVRLEGRRPELAIRAALGSGRAGWAKRILLEAVLLGIGGGLLGLAISAGAIRGLSVLAPPELPRLEEIRLDAGSILLVLGVAVVVMMLVAAIPLARMPADTPRGLLGEARFGTTSGPDRQLLRSALIAFQVGLSLVLVVAAGLLLQSFRQLRALDPGFEPRDAYAMELNLSDRDRYPGQASMWAFYEGVLEELRQIPGVAAAGISQNLPLTGGFGCTVQGFEDPAVRERLAAASLTTCAAQEPTGPGWFATMGIPLLQGRDLTAADNAHPTEPVVVVSRAFAERFWPGEDPIGKGVAPNGNSGPYYRVVGVVGDVHDSSPADEHAIVIYYPVVPIPGTPAWSPSQMTLVVRTDGRAPSTLLPALRGAVWRLDPTVPVESLQPLGGLLSRSMARVTFTMTLLALAATIALALAAMGLYGVISYLVASRRREIGIRVALGARVEQVQRLVIGRALGAVFVGLAAGGAVAIVSMRSLRGLLHGVSPGDPLPFLFGAGVLLIVAVAASYLPARRAAKLDPATALRID